MLCFMISQVDLADVGFLVSYATYTVSKIPAEMIRADGKIKSEKYPSKREPAGGWKKIKSEKYPPAEKKTDG